MGNFQDSRAMEKGEADLADRAVDSNPKGRKDGGKEEVPDEKKLKKELPALAKSLQAKREAVAAYNKKRKAVAKNCGFMSVIVDKAASEYLAEPEDLELATRHAEQLTLALGVVEKLKK